MNVVVVGSANLDLVVEVPVLPVAGQTVLGSPVLTRPGGKGANQAVAALRMGADVTFLGAVGNDAFGETLRDRLAATGLDLTHLEQLPTATGVALILVDQQAENVIAVAPGANQQLSLDGDGLDDRLTPETVLLTQLEIPVAICLAAAERARSAGGRVVVNAAPLTDAADPTLRTLLRVTDVLVVNQVEAAALIGTPVDGAAGAWAAGAERLRRLGPSTVVITLGPDGALVADAEGTVRVPSIPVHAVDSTGAGDAFCGVLAASLAADVPLRRAVRRACIAGALATTAVGAQEALPSAADLAAHELSG